MGRSPERKGLEPLVDSAARIRRRDGGRRLRLAFAGFADTDYAHRLLAGQEIGAFVPGELDQDVLRHDWYAAADLLVLPSMVEPFGLVALEAMACGVPAAVSDVAGAAEVISDRETGIILDSTRLGAELDALFADALDGRLDLAAMGAAARCDVGDPAVLDVAGHPPADPPGRTRRDRSVVARAHGSAARRATAADPGRIAPGRSFGRGPGHRNPPDQHRPPRRARPSGQRDQVPVVRTPQVLVPVGQEEHLVRLEGLDRSLVVGHEDDGSRVAVNGPEDLLA